MILAVILLIATPIILNVVSRVKVESFKSSVSNIIRTVEQEHLRDILVSGTNEGIGVIFPDINAKLNVRGKKPDAGSITVTREGQVDAVLYDEANKLCAIKRYTDEKITIIENILEEECTQNKAIPIIELYGDNPLNLEIELNEIYIVGVNDYRALTSQGEEIIAKIYIDGEEKTTIDRGILNKEYKIKYIVTEEEIAYIKERIIKIVDTTPPVITTPGREEIKSSEVASYNLRNGVSVVDNSGEELIFTIEGMLSKLPGSYEITYKSVDSNGNIGKVIRVIDVVDEDAPIIAIIGNNPLRLNVGETYTELGATAIDEVDGDVTDKIVISGSVDTNKVGTYLVIYTVEDNEGNESNATREVIVQDNIAPTIIFEPNGNPTYAKSRNIKVTVSDAHGTVDETSLRYGYNTSADDSGVMTSIFTNESSMPTPIGVSGIYYLWARAKDNSGNEVIARSNAIYLDNTPPELTIPENKVLKIHEVEGFNLRDGVSVSDNSGEIITVTVEGSLSKIAGSYEIIYRAIDSSGNVSTRVRVIDIVDEEAPVITIIGDNPVKINTGDTYIDAGAIAIDDADGDITNKIEVESNVNTNVAGEYNVGYRVVDSSGNEASKTRKVIVQEVIENKTMTVLFPERMDQPNQNQTVTIPNLRGITKITTNMGSVIYNVAGNNVTINVSGGIPTRTVNNPTKYSKSVSNSLTSTTNTFPSTNPYSDEQGYSSNGLNKTGSSRVISGSAGGSKTQIETMSDYFPPASAGIPNISSTKIDYDKDGYIGTLSYNSISYGPDEVVSGSGTFYVLSNSLSDVTASKPPQHSAMANYYFRFNGSPSKSYNVVNGHGGVATWRDATHEESSFWPSGGYLVSSPFINTDNPAGEAYRRYRRQANLTYKHTMRYATVTYSGIVTKPDTRTWQQDYSGNAYKSGIDNYYSYTVTIEYQAVK